MDKVTKYLVCCYLYYIEFAGTPISDYEFDILCRELLDEFNTIEHEFKHLLDKNALAAGTGYQISAEKYPDSIKTLAGEY
jgi:hypothetical protein